MSSREVRIEVRKVKRLWTADKLKWETERATYLSEIADLRKQLSAADPMVGLKMLERALDEARIYLEDESP